MNHHVEPSGTDAIASALQDMTVVLRQIRDELRALRGSAIAWTAPSTELPADLTSIASAVAEVFETPSAPVPPSPARLRSELAQALAELGPSSQWDDWVNQWENATGVSRQSSLLASLLGELTEPLSPLLARHVREWIRDHPEAADEAGLHLVTAASLAADETKQPQFRLGGPSLNTTASGIRIA